MARLITFGCSLTYGHGLEDCWTKSGHPTINPSKYAWPQLVADELEIECLNFSQPGASNKYILYTLQNFVFQKNDIVLCLWSHAERYTVLKENDYRIIGPWINEKYVKMYYKHLYDDYDGLHDLYTRANWAKNYLDLLDIKNLHAVCSEKYKSKLFDAWNRVDFLSFYMHDIREEHPRALDGSHPGPNAHKEYAKLMVDIIKENNYNI
jgi:hypothetical protein